MSRPSPASNRIVTLLNFLAEHPDETFRLSDIARRLDFNKATAHGMLGVLTEAEYLRYDEETKRFGLGPSIVGLALSAVSDDARLASFAAPHMKALSEAIGAQVIVNVVIADEFIVIASQGQPAAGGRGTRVGYRGRLVPPIGMVYHAWGSSVSVETWLDRINADAQERARYRTLLAAVAERGFSAAIDQEMRAQLDKALSDLHDASAPELRKRLSSLITEIAHEEHELFEIDVDRTYLIRQISAPIFDAQGAVKMGLYVTGLPEQDGRTLLDNARLTVAAARRITESVAGTSDNHRR